MGGTVNVSTAYAPSFDGDRKNWNSWRKQALSSMAVAGFRDVMTGAEPKPDEESLVALAAWKTKSQTLYHRMVMSLKGPAIDLVADDDVEDGAALWKSIVQHFEGIESLRKSELRQRFMPSDLNLTKPQIRFSHVWTCVLRR